MPGRSPSGSVEDRKRFAERLRWHLDRGTRPKGKKDRWKNAGEFAGAVKVSISLVRHWLKGNAPPNLGPIEIALFGENPDEDNTKYAGWRCELKMLYAKARGESYLDCKEEGQPHKDNDAASETAIASQKGKTESNIKIRVPEHFLGREEEMALIERAFAHREGRLAITALSGLRGVGKTILAAAYAERCSGDYRATWWIKAQDAVNMRADLVGLGIRLNWVASNVQEEIALSTVMTRLHREGKGILLIYDSALNAASLHGYLPNTGASKVLVTSNAPDWEGLATHIEIRQWTDSIIGGEFLVRRTGCELEREAAEDLSKDLYGLPLAHEQAGAYCRRLGITLVEYSKRFANTPVKLLDSEKDAPIEYYNKRTVARTFDLAIDEAMKIYPTAEILIVYAALLATQPIPLIIFTEGLKLFSGDELDEAIAALRAFALVDRETILDEREPLIVTDTIRLHGLVREVAAVRKEAEAQKNMRASLLTAIFMLYPKATFDDVTAWPLARRFDPHVMELVADEALLPPGTESVIADLLDTVASYRHGAMGAHAQVRPLRERALALRERMFGPEHSITSTSLNNLALTLKDQGEFDQAMQFIERAVAIDTREIEQHPTSEAAVKLASSLSIMGQILRFYREKNENNQYNIIMIDNSNKNFDPTSSIVNVVANSLFNPQSRRGDLNGARQCYEQVVALRTEALGPKHHHTAVALNELANFLVCTGDKLNAKPLFERAINIWKESLKPNDPYLATGLSSIAHLEQVEGNFAVARELYKQALEIFQKSLGNGHPKTVATLKCIANLFLSEGNRPAAREFMERVLFIREDTLGDNDPVTASAINQLALLVQDQGDLVKAKLLLERGLEIYTKIYGTEHRETATNLSNLAGVLWQQGDQKSARDMYEHALEIFERTCGNQSFEVAHVCKCLLYLDPE